MVKVYNDGKEKYQSFEAYHTESDCYGFGATQEEAIEALKTDINNRILQLQALSFDVIMPVNGRGEPLK